MRYFVVWPNGSRFGPADAATLRQWMQESRVDVMTTLVEETTGRSTTVGHALGLVASPGPAPTQAQSPHPTTFPPTVGQFGYPANPMPFPVAMSGRDPSGAGDLAWAWMLGLASLAPICCIWPGTIPFGLFFGFRALRKGYSNAWWPLALLIGIAAVHLWSMILQR